MPRSSSPKPTTPYQTRLYYLNLISISTAIAFLFSVALFNVPLMVIFKPWPMFSLTTHMQLLKQYFNKQQQQQSKQQYTTYLQIGFIFSAIGDVCLALPFDMFLFGLISFALAHIAYIVAFLAINNNNKKYYFGLKQFLLFFILVVSIFMVLDSQNKLGQLRPYVILYAILIGTMGQRALVNYSEFYHYHPGAQDAILGAIWFMFSDTLIGINRFVYPFGSQISYAITIIPYWIGQYLLARSAVKLYILK
jgi:alkenylglycerophosphocholine/alkenylglycerophosphoethanolamine hydrolase